MTVSSMVKRAREASITHGMDTINEQAIMARQIEPLVNAIKQEAIDIRTRRQMPYSVYVDNYLLLHMGYESETDRYTIEDWLNFAGYDENVLDIVPQHELTQRGMYAAVDLVDSKGNVVATVPPMYPVESYVMMNVEDDKIDVDSTIGSKMNYIRKESENYREKGKVMRENFFNALSSRFSPELIEAHRKLWRNFFIKMNVMNPDGTLVVTADENGQLKVNNQNVPSANIPGINNQPTAATPSANMSEINSSELDDLFF